MPLTAARVSIVLLIPVSPFTERELFDRYLSSTATAFGSYFSMRALILNIKSCKSSITSLPYPVTQEVVKGITAKYTAQELISQREKVRSEIKELLKQRMIAYYIIVDDFSIINFKFSNQFEQAIESKQAADQLAQKAQRDLERIKIEAEQKIAQAKAEAESLRLQKENVTPQLIQLRKIEASIKAIDKWDGHMPRVAGNTVPFIDLGSLEDSQHKK